MTEKKLTIDIAKHVESLVAKANNAANSHEALHFSQAALNCAHALRELSIESRQ